MPSKILGIDIGTYSVKVAVIERSFRAFAFTEFYERRVVYNDLLSPEESQAIAIQGLIDDQNLKWDAVSVGFPSHRVTSRLLKFPFGNAKKIDQSIAYEIEAFIPFSVEDVVLDYVTLEMAKDSSKVMVLYVQKKELVKLLTMLATVNVDPRFIGIEGVDYVGLINLGMVPPEGAFGIIDMGHSKSTITICRGENLGYLRAVSIAGKAITEAIAKKVGVPLDEAERLKVEVGRILTELEEETADTLTKEVSGAVQSVMDEFLLHLKQTLFAFRDAEKVPVEGIYLCGGTSRLPGLERHISDALRLNVTYLNAGDFHFNRIERADAHRHAIPQALALALRATANAGPEVNLRKGEFAFKGDVEELGGSVKKIGFIIGFIIFLALVNFTAKYYAVSGQLEKLQENVAGLVKQAFTEKEKAEIDKKVGSADDAVAYVKKKSDEVSGEIKQLGLASTASPFDVLLTLSRILPPRDKLKLEVFELVVVGNQIKQMKVALDSAKAASELESALKGSFDNVTQKPLRQSSKSGEQQFEFAMDLKSAKPETPKEGAVKDKDKDNATPPAEEKPQEGKKTE